MQIQRRVALFILVIFLNFFFLASETDARSGCCSHHGGVCGCGCCDGTGLSATCAPYYPQCSGGGSSAPAAVTTPTPVPVPVPVPTSAPVKEVCSEKETCTAQVQRVVDGDTIELSTGETVRYIGIDTPETVHPSKPVECFGEEASAKNKELVEGQEVRLEKDISDKDKYDRLLRYVYVGDTFVNDELVREGYAHATSYPPDVEHEAQFREDERLARENGLGLWAEGVCGEVLGQETAEGNADAPSEETSAPENQDTQGAAGSQGASLNSGSDSGGSAGGFFWGVITALGGVWAYKSFKHKE